MSVLPEPYVDFDDEPDPELNELTNQIIGAAIEVHRELGPGYPESMYGKALALEFQVRGIPFSQEHPVDVQYKGTPIGEGRLDFLVFGKIVVELKAVEALHAVHTAQMIAYLKATGCKLGLILNFNVKTLKDGVKRVAR